MRTVIDHVLIKADPNKNLTKSLGKDPEGNEIKIWIDNAFNPHATEFVTQEGEVMVVPEKLSRGKMELNVGDYVFTHHFLTDVDQCIEGDIYRLEYELIYARRKGKSLEMIGHWNFLEVIEKIDTRLFVPDHLKINRSTTTGTAKFLSKKLSKQIKPGDTVIYRKRMDYSMFVDGAEYLRVHDSDICGILSE